MTNGLNDCVALVTGAAGNIGSAIMHALAEDGASVVATDIATRIPTTGFDADWLELDVTDEQDWIAAAELVRRRYGRLDILVNNAAIAMVSKISDTSLEKWRRCQQINVDGVFLGLKATVGLLADSGRLRKGGASVINMSSAGGIVAAPLNSAYCTSKGAVRLLTKSAAVEFSALGYPIRVNSVHPGVIRGDMMASISDSVVAEGAAGSREVADRAFVSSHPIGRMGEPEEIAAAVAFLASDEASFFHGSEVVPDGGFTAR